jgi:hypothetical protein
LSEHLFAIIAEGRRVGLKCHQEDGHWLHTTINMIHSFLFQIHLEIFASKRERKKLCREMHDVEKGIAHGKTPL